MRLYFVAQCKAGDGTRRQCFDSLAERAAYWRSETLVGYELRVAKSTGQLVLLQPSTQEVHIPAVGTPHHVQHVARERYDTDDSVDSDVAEHPQH